ncbi:hypothetical protein F66182_5905 [Fusarium sp. NRRL 66182]|nr:hypothetical protein F66182_5905 [Fusarium sp. NRRL 66182]
MSDQVAAIVAEANQLRQTCEEQRAEIEHLRTQSEWCSAEVQFLRGLGNNYEQMLEKKDSDMLGLHILVDAWKVDCQAYKDELVKVRQQVHVISNKNEYAQSRVCELEEKVSLGKGHINKLVTIIHDRARTAQVYTIALKAAYKVLPNLENKVTFKKIIEMAKKAPVKQAVETKVALLLEEAGIDFDAEHAGKGSPSTAKMLREAGVEHVDK